MMEVHQSWEKCDTQACKQCNDTLDKIYAPPTGHIASLEIAGKFITSHIASAIKEASYHKELTQYITNRSRWQNTETFYCIDWEARSRAGKLVPPGQRLTLLKLEFALFATMSRRHKMERAIDHRCPRCQKFQETLAHVFQCSSAVELCRKALMKVQATIWKNLHASLWLTHWYLVFPNGQLKPRFNGVGPYQVQPMTLEHLHLRHFRNNKLLDGTRPLGGG